jgi:alpha-tubulin suppressor-like RCC1 family protein
VQGGGAAGTGANVPTFVWDAGGGVPATSVSTGYLHACAMWTNGGPYREANCWGSNRAGQSGANMAYYPATAYIGTGPDLGGTALRVATQNNFTCADQPGPLVQCFGDNYWGQLGNGQMTASPTWQPQTVGGGLALRAVTTGLNHACALDPNGAAYCWGNGYWGQLGHGVSGLSSTPVAVGGGLTFKAIAAGQQHTCAIGTNNHLYCWGSNSGGQLGTQYPGGWVSNPVQALDPQ